MKLQNFNLKNKAKINFKYRLLNFSYFVKIPKIFPNFFYNTFFRNYFIFFFLIFCLIIKYEKSYLVKLFYLSPIKKIYWKKKTKKFSKTFWFKDLGTQEDLSVIELYTQL